MNIPMGSTSSPAGLPNGQNENGSSDPRAVLAAMVAERELPASPEPERSPTPVPITDPESPASTTEADAPGQDFEPSHETPPGEVLETAPGESENPPTPSPSSDPNDLSAALDRLDETQRNQLLGMLQDVTEGRASWNDLKRGHKLANEFGRKLEEVTSQLEQLKSDRELETPAAKNGSVPASVAGLKTLAEIQARMEEAENHAETLQQFLEENSGDADTVYPVGDRQISRRELVQRKAAWREELRQLPRRAEQIKAQAQAQANIRQENQFARLNHPWLTDPDHVETKLVREYVAKHPGTSEFVAAALVRGLKSLEQEYKARNGKNGGQRPAGVVAAGKPHSPARSTSPKQSEGVDMGSVMKRVRQEGSLAAGAALLEATGR